MLTMIATTKTNDGTRRLNPSERPRAVAHTASKNPDTQRTIQDMTEQPFLAVLSQSGYSSLVRQTVVGPYHND